MRLSLFTLENILLFEASLALYGQFVGAVTREYPRLPSFLFVRSDGRIANASSCGGCTITAGPKTLTYPADVSEVTKSVTATVIPFIYQYDNGTEVTSYSTYTASGGVQSVFTSPARVTWTTLGTVLTYPTTYLAFISPLAGVSSSQTGANGFCYASLTTISIQTPAYSNLIFPSTAPADHDIITSAASKYLDTLPSIAAAVSPYKPAACSHLIGVDSSKISGSPTNPAFTTSRTVLVSIEPVTHTSVAFLLQTGKPVITRVPAVGQNQGGGSQGGGYQGSTTPGSNYNPTTGPSKPPSSVTPILNVGGSSITAGPSGDFAIGTRTLTRGGSAVVDGTTVVLATDGSVVVINGQTSTLAATSTGPVVNGDASRVGLSGFAVAVIGFLGLWL
jgi:hypothetical protein